MSGCGGACCFKLRPTLRTTILRSSEIVPALHEQSELLAFAAAVNKQHHVHEEVSTHYNGHGSGVRCRRLALAFISSTSRLPGQESVEVCIPILVGVLAFIEDLEPELVVLEALAELLPCHFVSHILEDPGDLPLVIRVRTAFKICLPIRSRMQTVIQRVEH